MIASVDHNAAIAYTDGSSIGNPGPSGAGAFVTFRSPARDGGSTETFLSYPLGHNTNNVGELWAIGMAVSFVLDHPATPPGMVVFTDSDTSLNLINRLTFSVELEHLVEAIRALISQLQYNGTKFSIRWVPGHVGILGNELADRCADHGARTNRLNALVYPLPNERFSYLACPEPRLSPPESE
jgi:ribonuclease HI